MTETLSRNILAQHINEIKLLSVVDELLISLGSLYRIELTRSKCFGIIDKATRTAGPIIRLNATFNGVRVRTRSGMDFEVVSSLIHYLHDAVVKYITKMDFTGFMEIEANEQK
jgi:hypothetical protein